MQSCWSSHNYFWYINYLKIKASSGPTGHNVVALVEVHLVGGFRGLGRSLGSLLGRLGALRALGRG